MPLQSNQFLSNLIKEGQQPEEWGKGFVIVFAIVLFMILKMIDCISVSNNWYYQLYAFICDSFD